MSLFDKLLGSKKGNSPAQTNEKIEHSGIKKDLAAHTKPLKLVQAGFEKRVLDFLLTGNHADVLLTLQGNRAAFDALNFGDNYWKPAKEVNFKRALNYDESANPYLLLRLGQLWAVLRQAANVSNDNADLAPDWLDALMSLAADRHSYNNNSKNSTIRGLTATALQQAFVLDEQNEDGLVQLLMVGGGNWDKEYLLNRLKAVRGMQDYLQANTDKVAEYLPQSKGLAREYALGVCVDFKIPPKAILPALCDISVGTAKGSAKLAMALMDPVKSEAFPLLEAKLNSSAAGERQRAATLLHIMFGAKALKPLEALREREKSVKVKEALDQILSSGDEQQDDAAGPELPALADYDTSGELDPSVRDGMRKVAAQMFEQMRNHYEHFGGHERYRPKKPTPISDSQIDRLFKQLNQQGKVKGSAQMPDKGWSAGHFRQLESAFADVIASHESSRLHHLLRLRALFDDLAHRMSIFNSQIITIVLRDQIDLRQLAAQMKATGVDVEDLGRNWIESWYRPTLPDALVWPYFAERPELLRYGLGLTNEINKDRYYVDQYRKNTLALLASFPEPLPVLIPALFDLATGGPKTSRADARAALAGYGGVLPRVIKSLESGQQDIRAGAAEWLADLGKSEAIEPLKKAIKKEKRDIAKASMLNALESLGEEIEPYLNIKGLLAEAEKGLKPGIPKNLDWFNFDALPTVRWAKGNRKIDPAIVRWWLVQGVKLKSAEPNPLLRKYMARLNPQDARDLGHYVLQAWITADTTTADEGEAIVEAKKRWAGFSKDSWYTEYYKTEDNYIKQHLNDVRNSPIRSAIKEKGLLAIPACVPDERTADIVGRYLKTWYGMRAAQCKSLLQMLHWVEHDTAIQLQLSISRRFRTASIRDEAQRLVTELAERKGWTLDELADRTIPTAGLDDTAKLQLDFGETKVTALLDEKFKFVIEKEDGKRVKALPAPRKADNEEMAKDAKKQFSAAKRELKQVLDQQKTRLYEAMCTGRQWRYSDWAEYLNGHPIVGRYCQQLVWGAFDDKGELVQSFRPLADGSLTDVNDDEPSIADDANIQLLHTATIDDNTAAEWREHLADYEVESLFPQLPESVYRLPDNLEGKAANRLDNFHGHMLESFALRGVASKRGYSRGQAEDGGWFYTYHKEFPGLGLTAELEFTGNGLPEENRPVALLAMRFVRKGQESGWGVSNGIALAEVPEILLAESYYDMQQMSAKGSGYDADWEKKSAY